MKKKNSQEEITSTTKGQQLVHEKMADYWANIFADEHITTTEHDIDQRIGEEANNSTLKLIDEERKEIEKNNNHRGLRPGSKRAENKQSSRYFRVHK